MFTLAVCTNLKLVQSAINISFVYMADEGVPTKLSIEFCLLIGSTKLFLVSTPDPRHHRLTRTKKRSGEPSQISWASTRFCN